MSFLVWTFNHSLLLALKMINTTGFEQLIGSNVDETKNIFLSCMTREAISFFNINEFPESKGIYLIYKNNMLNNPIYIGSAYAETRTLKMRCRQYLQKGSGGESFRGKIEDLKGINNSQAIEFIKNNFSAKFIELPNENEDKIKQLEQLAIWGFSPKLNFILKRFIYGNVNFKYQANKAN